MGQIEAHASLPPLTTIAGFHLTTIADDLLHDDLLGIRPALVGSALVELCDRGIWGHQHTTDWKGRLSKQLREAYTEFRSWSKANALPNSQALFKPCTLSMSTRDTSWPVLKTKA